MKNINLTILLVTILMANVNANTDNKESISSAKVNGPWNIEQLKAAPAFKWVDCNSGVWSLEYKALPSPNGPATSVFAYFATPGTLAAKKNDNQKYPGIVLVHGGGGGTAFKEWVELWARHGYAALSMDLNGCTPDRKKLEHGGPALEDSAVFTNINGPLSTQWPYHAVANVIIAHSLMLNLPQVDPDRTAVTGVSWGGFLTCIVAGLDNRFKAAVPVYGCGYIYQNSGWVGQLETLPSGGGHKWIQQYDPSKYLGNAHMPMFFVTGTNDTAYPLDIWANTCKLPKSPVLQRLEIEMLHGHSPAWAVKEIQMFVDQCLLGSTPLSTIVDEAVDGTAVTARVNSKTKIVSASLNYTTDSNSVVKHKWYSKPAVLNSNVISTILPQDATAWFINICDHRDAITSSRVHFK